MGLGLLYDPGRVDDNVYGAQVRGHFCRYVRNGLLVAHVDVVELDGYARRRVQFRGRGVPELLLHVEQGDGFGAGFGERLRHVPAQTSGAAACWVWFGQKGCVGWMYMN